MATPSKTPEKPPEPLVTIVEPKVPQLNSQTTVYEPSAEDLERLAKNGGPNPLPVIEDAPTRAMIIPPSTAKRTMAEMERGREIVGRKTEERRKRMEAAEV